MTALARALIRRASRVPTRQFVAAVPAGVPRREKVARELVLVGRRQNGRRGPP